MKILQSLFLACITFHLMLVNTAQADQDGPLRKDSDWNWSARPNCKPPRRDSIRWMKQAGRKFVRFQLRDGDIGNCSTDNDKAHNEKYNKPYGERAEWNGPAFDEDNATYEISFDVRFAQGFDSDTLSATFFQIKNCPSSKVPVMAKLGGWKKKQGGRSKVAFSLGAGHPKAVYKSKFLDFNPVDNRWHRIVAIFERGKTNALEVKLDGHTLLSRTTFPNVFTCKGGKFHIGIYRSGDLNGNSHSIVDYDRIQIRKLN